MSFTSSSKRDFIEIRAVHRQVSSKNLNMLQWVFLIGRTRIFRNTKSKERQLCSSLHANQPLPLRFISFLPFRPVDPIPPTTCRYMDSIHSDPSPSSIPSQTPHRMYSYYDQVQHKDWSDNEWGRGQERGSHRSTHFFLRPKHIDCGATRVDRRKQ